MKSLKVLFFIFSANLVAMVPELPERDPKELFDKYKDTILFIEENSKNTNIPELSQALEQFKNDLNQDALINQINKLIQSLKPLNKKFLLVYPGQFKNFIVNFKNKNNKKAEIELYSAFINLDAKQKPIFFISEDPDHKKILKIIDTLIKASKITIDQNKPKEELPSLNQLPNLNANLTGLSKKA